MLVSVIQMRFHFLHQLTQFRVDIDMQVIELVFSWEPYHNWNLLHFAFFLIEYIYY